jgi:hypothetical protein
VNGTCYGLTVKVRYTDFCLNYVKIAGYMIEGRSLKSRKLRKAVKYFKGSNVDLELRTRDESMFSSSRKI